MKWIEVTAITGNDYMVNTDQIINFTRGVNGNGTAIYFAQELLNCRDEYCEIARKVSTK